MILKPAVLECTRCGKIFIGYDRDDRPKGWPRCLKCTAREAWITLTDVVAKKKSRAVRARKGRTAPKPSAGRAAKKPRAGARPGKSRKKS
jgi:hypothetical protein